MVAELMFFVELICSGSHQSGLGWHLPSRQVLPQRDMESVGMTQQTRSSWGNPCFILEGHLWGKPSFPISHTPSLQGLGLRVFLRTLVMGKGKKTMHNKWAAEFKLPLSITPLHRRPMVLGQLPPQTPMTLVKIWPSKLQQGQPGVTTLRHDCLSKEIHARK